MKRILQLGAVSLAAAGLLIWASTGASRGWTKTSVEVRFTDEVTGLEGTRYQKGFYPGVDFLGATLLGAVVLGGLSFFFSKSSKNSLNTSKP